MQIKPTDLTRAAELLNELRSEAEKFETLTREISGRKALFETFRLAGEGEHGVNGGPSGDL